MVCFIGLVNKLNRNLTDSNRNKKDISGGYSVEIIINQRRLT